MPYIGNNHIAGDHTNNFKVLDDISSFTATFDGSATSVVDTTNNTIRVVEHRFIQGQRVTYTNGGGGNIGGLTTGTAYFVIFDSASTIKLATSAANAATSTAINLSAVGTGSSHTLNAAFDGVNTKFKLTHSSGTGARLNNATQVNVAINNVLQRPNLDPNNFTDGFALEDNHKIVFQTAPTSEDIFWGSIIANTLTTFDISDHKIDTFTGDGSTTEFTLSHTPANNESLMVTINGVLQHPSNASTARAYTLIASIIQFTAAPGVGDEIQVRHLGFAGATTADVSGFYGRTGNVVLTDQDDVIVNKISVGTGATIESNGQATFTGIVTFGSSSTTINNNVVNVGTALTLGHTQGVQFHTQNLHADGFEINNINASGIITASQFVGNIGGNPTFSGDATFDGSVSIGGTLTYEDVTNIDSIGIVTARDGLKVLAGGANIVGVVTANTFKGDGDFVDIDVDGHTNLDNGNVAGIVTFNTGSALHMNGGQILLYDRPDGNSNNLFFGTGGKAVIYHDGTNFSQVNNTGHFYLGQGVGNKDLMLYAQASGNVLLQQNTGVRYVKGVGSDASVQIFFNNNLKLNTTNTGINITGNTVADGLVIDGNSDLNGDLDVDGHTNLDNISVAGVSTFSGVVRVPNGSAAAPAIHFGDSDSGVYGDSSNGVRLTAGGSDTIVATTNGVTFPSSVKALTSLTIGTQSALSKPLYFADAASVQSASILLDNSSQELRIKNGRFSGAITFTTYNTEKLRITSGGRVQIAANGDLYVVGGGSYNSRLSGNILSFDRAGYSYIDQTSDSGSLVFRVGSSSANMLRLDTANAYFPNGTLMLGTQDSSSGHINAYENMSFNIDTDNDDTNRYFSFNANGNSASGTELVRITSTGIIRITGTGSNGTNGQLDFGDDYRILKYTDQNTMTLQSPKSVVINIDNNNNNTDAYFQIKKDTTNPETGGTELFIVQENGQITQTAASGDTILTLKRSDTNTTGTVGAINFAASDGHSVASIQARGDGDNEGAHILFYTTSAAAGDMYNSANIARLRIASDGKVHMNYDASSNAGNDKLNIMGGGDGITIARGTSNASDGNILGNINFHSYMNGSYHSNAEAKIQAIADTGQSGSSAPTHLDFYTKPSGVGPGNSPSLRLRITSGGTVQIGSSVHDSGDVDSSNTKLTIKQSGNAMEDGLYIERSGERKGYYMRINPSPGAGDALTFARNNNGTKADVMALDRDGTVIITDGNLEGVNGYSYCYPGNYRTASNKARFMARVNYASGVYWPGDNGTPITSLSSAYDTNTGGNFGSNGSASENNLGYADHNGLAPCAAVWRAQNNDSESGPDGGWNKGINGLPGDDWGYMVTCHVRRVGSNYSGSFYFGCSGSHTLNQNGSQNYNPYFFSMGISALPMDIWCLVVGIITPNGAGAQSNPTGDSINGMWRLDSGDKITTGNWYRMKDGSTSQVHRTYLFYSTQSAAHLQWRQPGFYVMDGSEPSISELSHGRLCFKTGTGIVAVENA